VQIGYYGFGMDPDHPTGPAPDELFELQLSVARRADKLARTREKGASLNLHCWLIAEMEVLGTEIDVSFDEKRPPPAAPKDPTD
jgi:hypothetical protein